MAGETFVSGLASTLRLPRDDGDRAVNTMLQAALQKKLMEEQMAWRNEQMRQQGLTQEREAYRGMLGGLAEKFGSLNPKNKKEYERGYSELERQYNTMKNAYQFQYLKPAKSIAEIFPAEKMAEGAPKPGLFGMAKEWLSGKTADGVELPEGNPEIEAARKAVQMGAGASKAVTGEIADIVREHPLTGVGMLPLHVAMRTGKKIRAGVVKGGKKVSEETQRKIKDTIKARQKRFEAEE